MFRVPTDAAWSKEHYQMIEIKNFNSVLHSGRNPASGQEFTRSGITSVQVEVDAKLLQILNALSTG